ncbi:MAG: UDP-N-acetylmuramoyl-L-alanyl-D-glutamate--2,6-diaminopimelate ligase [Actinobacteria bacterium]|nr:UDP-N-acetylmuramoyl-L-alanyl-D-glutamate--2,6-diaminopimelate ligase [Actinomycetota bacterium]
MGELVGGIAGVSLLRGAEKEVSGVAYDSRRVGKGDLFVAVRGLRTDGHLYVEEALERGAVALVVCGDWERGAEVPPDVALARAADTRLALALISDRYYRHPSGRLALVGVTGTNGKTTTAHLVEAAAVHCGLVCGLVGTVSYRVAGREVPAVRTTPESTDLQAMLAEMVEAGCAVASMEVSSHALSLRRVDGCEFAVGVFTNLTQDHLDFHSDMEDYYRSKERLFSSPSRGGLGAHAAAVNVDDPYGRRVAERAAGKVLTYGTSREAELRCELLEAGLKRSRLAVEYEGRRWEGETAITGRFNLHNILAALAASILLDLDPERALEGILSHPGVPGRFQAVEEGQDFAVVIDYAHTPDSLRRVLEAAREIARGRVLVVFGCGGDRDRGKRPLMGEVAAKLADLAFITSDNPRSEDPLAIIAQIERGARGASGGGSYEVIEDRRAAIRAAVEAASAGDVVVVAGKGHERGQVFSDRVIPFDDLEEARMALRERKARG